MSRCSDVDRLVRDIAPQVEGAVLVAVGGYGREDLYPQSDIDILLVCAEEQTASFKVFFQKLWDCGFDVGHGTQSLDRCLEFREDEPELTFKLIDRRYLSGDQGLWDKLDGGFAAMSEREREAIAQTAKAQAVARRSEFQNTVYHLEPNVKDGPGGLRDIHALRWFGQAGDLEEAESVLRNIRTELHKKFGRDKNVLTFAAQDTVGPSPEIVMAGYYRAARKVNRAMRLWLDPSSATQVAAPLNWPELEAILNATDAPRLLRALNDEGALGALLPGWKHIEGMVVRDYYHRYTVDEHSLVAVENAVRLQSELPGLFSEMARHTGHFALLLMALVLHDTGKGRGAESHAEASVRTAETDLIAIGMPEEDRELVLFLIRNHLSMSETMTTRDLSDPQTTKAIADLTGSHERLALLTLMTYADISAVNPAALTPWRTALLAQLYSASSAAIPKPDGAGVSLQRSNGVWKLELFAKDRPFLLASVAGAISSFGMDILHAEAFSTSEYTVREQFTFSDPNQTLALNPGERTELAETVRRAAEGTVDVEKLLRKRERKQRNEPSIRPRFDNDVSAFATVLTVDAEDRPGLLYRLARAISATGCDIEKVMINTEGRAAKDVFYILSSRAKLTQERQDAIVAEINSRASS